jgi:hypothetical protein
MLSSTLSSKQSNGKRFEVRKANSYSLRPTKDPFKRFRKITTWPKRGTTNFTTK